MKQAWSFAIAGAVLLFAVGADAAVETRLISSKETGWPQFRGPRRDGISDERGLLQQWPEAGPRVVWSVTNVGRGFSSPIFAKDRLFITGDFEEHLVLLALDLTGKPLWRVTNGSSWKVPYPGARSTPTFSDGRLYHENAHGRVVSLDAASGSELWAVDVLKQFGGSNITWGLSECLLVDDRAVFVTAGGADASVVALDKKSGAVLWKTPALHDSAGERKLENASYVSPMLVQFGTRRLVIGCSLRNLWCVDAVSGALQWTYPMPTSYSVLAMPPALVGDAVFMTAPHGKGGRLLRLIEGTNGLVGVKEEWRTDLDTCQGGVIVDSGRIYGSFYGGRKGWAAVDAGSGKVLYQTSDFVKGAPLLVDGRLYALAEDGWMLLLEPTSHEFKGHGKFRFAQATPRDAWAHPVVCDGRLYLRYHQTLSCFDVKRR